MRAAKRWLLWKSENSSKVPYYVIGGKRSGTLDSPDDLAKFASYEEARSAMERNPGTYTGLAFALGPDSTGNRWQGIDLDDVEINKLSEFANELPGYVELSPSRNGCHAIGYGRSFITLGSNGTGVEAYEHGRFFTVTEHLIRDSPLSCLSEYVEQRLAPRHRPTAGSSAKSAHIHGVVNLPAQEVSELRSALLHMRADEYGQWIAVGHALVELGDVGRGLWLNWSSTSAVYDESEAAAKWDTFSGDKTAYQAVFKRAQEQGWVNPRSNAARLPKAEVSGEFGNIRVSVADVITDPSPPPEFLIEDLLPAGEVTLLPANGGVGKSLLTLIASVCLATGKPFMGKQTKACRVLFFSAEDATGVIRHRLKRICEHLDVDPVTLSANLWITDATENPCLFIEMQDK